MKNLGFSLIEIIVVLAVIAGLTVALIPQFNSFSKSQSLETEAGQLQAALREAQNFASSGVVCVNDTTKDKVQASKWYVEFAMSGVPSVPDSYKIAASCPIGTTAQTTVYKVSPNVKISSIVVDDGPNTCSLLSGSKVAFTNIAADVQLDDCNPPINPTTMTITLVLASDPTKQIQVKVQVGGSIYIKS